VAVVDLLLVSHRLRLIGCHAPTVECLRARMAGRIASLEGVTSPGGCFAVYLSCCEARMPLLATDVRLLRYPGGTGGGGAHPDTGPLAGSQLAPAAS
jgi:hypothetical protein